MLPLFFVPHQASTTGAVVSPFTFGRFTAGFASSSPPPGVVEKFRPDVLYDVAFDDPPLTSNPQWADLGQRVRGLGSTRGRAWEFERMETGTSHAILNNRDVALSPANTSSPFAPILSTRPVRARLAWNSVLYPLFRGISEGFPQEYPHVGLDAVVGLQVNDLFYALNNSRFTPGTTTVQEALTVVDQGTEMEMLVASTALPMPQSVPFTITVAGLTPEWPTEEMQVVGMRDGVVYRIVRSAETTYEHPVGAEVTTRVVNFGEEMSGARIQRVLEAVGFDSSWWDLDAGQSLIAASDDLVDVSPLEHINLIAEAEFGRFFVSRAGLFTYRDRHSVYLDHLAPVVTFAGGDLTPGGSDLPYKIEGALEHSEEKLFNHVRITIPDGTVVEVEDTDSIEQHFRRTFEREWPYANVNDATSAAQWILSHAAEHTLRLPTVTVLGQKNPSTLWPLLLAREIGDRARFRYQPEGGGTEIDRDVVIDGISHSINPGDHAMSFQMTEMSSQEYWILGKAGYSELGSTTVLGF